MALVNLQSDSKSGCWAWSRGRMTAATGTAVRGRTARGPTRRTGGPPAPGRRRRRASAPPGLLGFARVAVDVPEPLGDEREDKLRTCSEWDLRTRVGCCCAQEQWAPQALSVVIGLERSAFAAAFLREFVEETAPGIARNASQHVPRCRCNAVQR